ncbi:MAG: DUF6783 domain-containing protein [Ruminococcus sp.]
MANSRACLKKHSCNPARFPLCGIILSEFGCRSRYGALIRAKSPINCDAHLAESLFQTCSGIETSKIPAVKIIINSS